jgi:hypothetical protein
VRVRILQDPHDLEAAAGVIWAPISMGVGLAFTESKREHQASPRTWIAGRSGEETREPAASTPAPESGAMDANLSTRFILRELITSLMSKKTHYGKRRGGIVTPDVSVKGSGRLV